MEERLITLKPDWLLTPKGLRKNWYVTIQSGFIVDVGPDLRHPEMVESLPGIVLVPGFVNAHSHAFQRAFRGHVQWTETEKNDFWSWRDAMYNVANRLTPAGVFAVSRLAFLEMIEAGMTQVGEFHYLHHQPDGSPYDNPNELANQVIAAALDVGIRICLLRVAYARGGFKQPPSSVQRRFVDSDPEAVLEAVTSLSAHPDPRVSVGLAPHSVRAVDAAWMKAFSAYQGPIHMHVSEQLGENQSAEREYGISPLAAIETQGLLSERFTAVHMTHPVAGDLRRFELSGARICVCPTTEMDLGDGFLPTEYRESVPLCLGSDSQAVIDMMAESRALEMHARGVAGRRNVLTPIGERHGLASRLLDAATAQGQRALGGAGLGIEVGAPADLTGVQLARTAAFGMPPLEAVVFASNADWIQEVWVSGERVVREGRHPKRDLILQEAAYWMSAPQ